MTKSLQDEKLIKKMINPFINDEAKNYAQEFIKELEQNKSLYDFVGMFGILVCKKIKEGFDYQKFINSQSLYKTKSNSDDENSDNDELKSHDLSLRVEKSIDEKSIDEKSIDEKSIDEKSSATLQSEILPQDFITKEIVVLKAFSGQYKSRWNVTGFIPALIDQDEYDKAVLPNDKLIHDLSVTPINETEQERQIRNQKRLFLCNETLDKIYNLYKFTCFDKTTRTFVDINNFIKFNNANQKIKKLPTGVGDCTAPKLLSYAFRQNLLPISLAEFYWGKSNERLRAKKFYSPCDQKCKFILPQILGLEILYIDKHIIVVNKPSNFLSVPGRTKENKDCAVNRVRFLFPDCITQPSVHRLDMDTSGILVLAFTKEAHKNLSIQFEQNKVTKKYIAILDGVLNKGCNFENSYAQKLCPVNFDYTQKTKTNELFGTIKLKCRLDIDNRPYQIYDEIYGKEGITDWKKLKTFKFNNRNVTSVEFTPHNGRTHQLRLASASPLGFGIPIVGDNLYGIQNHNERLMLHASYIKFTHPITNEIIEIENLPEFKY